MNVGSVGVGAGINSNPSAVMGSITMQAEDQKTQGFQKALENAAKSKDDAKLKQACEDFESYYIQLMFKEMRKTIHSDSSFIPKSNAENIFQDMMDEEASKSAAKGTNGLGLARQLYNQLSKNYINLDDLE